MKQKLSSPQVRILLGLSNQKEELKKQFLEVQDAELEYMQMLKSFYGLEDGEYSLNQENNEIYIVKNNLLEKKIDKVGKNG